jgi:hypothetical protein
MSDELVPPKPKEFERNVSNSKLTILLLILSFSDASSGFSKFIVGAINEFCIIKME